MLHRVMCSNVGRKRRTRAGLEVLQKLADSDLLGKVWPCERVVLGRSVCRFLHNELLDHVIQVLFVQRGKPRNADAISTSLLTCRKQNRVTLRWKSDGDCACDSHISPCTEIFNALDMAIAKGFGDQLVGLEMTHYAFVFFEASRLASILSQCRWVEHLSLPGCKLERFLFESCTTLKHLDLSRNRLDNTAATTLANHINNFQNLEHLDLSCNAIGIEGARSLSQGLSECASTVLRHLDLSFNVIRAGSVTELTRTLLQGCSTLRTLLLRNNNYEQSVTAISPSTFKTNQLKSCALQTLDIGAVGIGVDGATRLSGILCSCPNLSHLALDDNALSQDGASYLASGLGECTRLRQLRLGNNELGDHGVTVLASALGDCRELTDLELNDNGIGVSGIAALSRALPRCWRLERLDIRSNPGILVEGEGRLAVVMATMLNAVD